MKRKDFFKVLGVGALAAVIAPKLLVSTEDSVPDIVDNRDISRIAIHDNEWEEQGRVHNMTKGEVMTVDSNMVVHVRNPDDNYYRIYDTVFTEDRNYIITEIIKTNSLPLSKDLLLTLAPMSVYKINSKAGDIIHITSLSQNYYAEQV